MTRKHALKISSIVVLSTTLAFLTVSAFTGDFQYAPVDALTMSLLIGLIAVVPAVVGLFFWESRTVLQHPLMAWRNGKLRTIGVFVVAGMIVVATVLVGYGILNAEANASAGDEPDSPYTRLTIEGPTVTVETQDCSDSICNVTVSATEWEGTAVIVVEDRYGDGREYLTPDNNTATLTLTREELSSGEKDTFLSVYVPLRGDFLSYAGEWDVSPGPGDTMTNQVNASYLLQNGQTAVAGGCPVDWGVLNDSIVDYERCSNSPSEW